MSRTSCAAHPKKDSHCVVNTRQSSFWHVIALISQRHTDSMLSLILDCSLPVGHVLLLMLHKHNVVMWHFLPSQVDQESLNSPLAIVLYTIYFGLLGAAWWYIGCDKFGQKKKKRKAFGGAFEIGQALRELGFIDCIFIGWKESPGWRPLRENWCGSPKHRYTAQHHKYCILPFI